MTTIAEITEQYRSGELSYGVALGALRNWTNTHLSIEDAIKILEQVDREKEKVDGKLD